MRTGNRNLLLICGLSTGVLETMDSVLFRDQFLRTMCYLPKRKSFPVNGNMDSKEREESCKKGDRVFRVRDGKYRSRAHSKREKRKQNKAWQRRKWEEGL